MLEALLVGWGGKRIPVFDEFVESVSLGANRLAKVVVVLIGAHRAPPGAPEFDLSYSAFYGSSIAKLPDLIGLCLDLHNRSRILEM